MMYHKPNHTLALWLSIVAICIITMIFIGGVTRLTDSGLSITEWNPVSGILPPINDTEWVVEFSKYQASPEYAHNNCGMSISEFKSIYWVEFFHRLAGRVTGLVYLLPLIFFIFKGYIRGRDVITYVTILVLFAMQGLMGWYMVKSGLVADPHVSHYRLAAHLMLAVLIYSLVFWNLMKNYFDIILLPMRTDTKPILFWCITSVILVLIQMIFGAFVAGLRAGLVYNEYPLMGGQLIPNELLIYGINLYSLNDPVFVQFMHRIIAYILTLSVVIFYIKSKIIENNKLARSAVFVLCALIIQITLGVATLLCQVPILLALLHQMGAVFLITCLLWSLYLLYNI